MDSNLVSKIKISVKCAENCAELYDRGETESGVYRISPQPKIWFDVYCDQDSGLSLAKNISPRSYVYGDVCFKFSCQGSITLVTFRQKFILCYIICVHGIALVYY